MARKVTLFTGQWADLPIAELAPKAKSFGYDGLELACWGDHIEVDIAVDSKSYCDDKRALLAEHGLGVWAISNHLAGQLVSDNNDARSAGFVIDPARRGSPEEMRDWAIDQMKKSAIVAKNFGVDVVNGFTGSPIWHLFYSFPPWTPDMIKNGYKAFAEQWKPILDIYAENGIKFALEVHPTEIAYDVYTAEAAIDALNGHPAFGFNFDPSHLVWQAVEPAPFIRIFADRIFHVHMKDVRVSPDGKGSILGSHLDFGDYRRAWDFVSVGRGDVDFESIIRALNDIGYAGPLSVEWEDSGMDREHGATEAAAFCKQIDFAPSGIAFDAQFSKD